jgi:S-DNA-T family DNA segregation ATPase FtsK/SpoIIIE
VSQAPRQRASKAPRVESGGLSLDNKLDILGVALVLGSLALFFSRMSATKGALTEWANNLITTTFGWGALAIPIVMLAVGIWLIARHFGEQAPVIPRNRIVGIILTYFGGLILLQFIDSFSYIDLQTGLAPDLNALRRIYLPLAISRGTGGGSIGAELYYLLVSNFTEYGAFFMMVLVLVIGIMFTLDIGAAQLAMIIIGNLRGIGDAWQRRAQERQARAAEAALQQLTAPSGAPALTVSKPAEALPAPGAPALPSPIEAALPLGQPARAERPIAIRVGGMKLGDKQAEQQGAASLEGSAQSAARGGFGARLRGALPLPGRASAPAEKSVEPGKSGVAATATAAAAGGLRGLFNRGAGSNQVESPAPEKVAAPSPVPTSVAAAPAPTMTPAPGKLNESPARLGELLKPVAEAAGQPAVDSATPATVARPAIPAAAPPPAGRRATSEQPAVAGMPASGGSKVSPARLAAPPGVVKTPMGKPEDVSETTVRPASPQPASEKPRPDAERSRFTPAAPDRNSRLNEIRSGGTAQSAAEKPVTGAPPARVTPFSGAPAASSSPASRPTPPAASVAPSAAKPAEPAQAASPAFGKPDTPPPLRGGLRGGEIAIRQPGVGTTAPTNAPRKRKEWKLPNISSLLMPGSEGDFDREMLLRRARIIEDTLQSFGAPGKVVEVNTGPVITQFGVEPDYLTTRGGKKNRVKVSAIAQLDKDIQLALGAKSIRIEAPVPGKGYVGIEVPNDTPSLVSLRDVMESESFKKIKSPLAIALGQAVDGTPIAADLTSMPHLLIAGTTGSGKSVCVNAIIGSLVTRNSPDRVKFIMVDPKRVELTGYNGVPHLVAPVVVELERIVGVLKWVTREMDERYKRFSNAGARNIEDYNKHLNEDAEPMPYIIVIIDELADLMMLAPDETERVITRIAALARATGIHLVIATQRPSVDVVTGLIKANFPARIAFAVAGGVDSRVILDQPGAERLLGRGDMLYMSGDSPAPLRLQGVFVSDNEIDNIVRYWKQQVTPDDLPARPIPALIVDNSVAEPSAQAANGSDRGQTQQAFWDKDEKSSITSFDSDDGGDVPADQDDELYEEAVEMVRRLNKASVSLLQRRLRIGYTRAARLIDRMEEEGIVGPAVEGSKPRDVIG